MTAAKLLTKLKISGELREYLKESMKYIKKEKIECLDVNLQSGLYPYLADVFKYTETSIKTKFIKSLCEFNENNPDVIKEYFNVNCRITVKKLIILMSLELKK